MTNKSPIALLLFFCLLLAQTAVAVELKLGFVDTARVLKMAPQADAARKKLEKEFAPRDQSIVSMQKKLKTQEDKLKKNQAVMSDAKRKKSERDILSLQRDIKRSKEEFNEDLNLRRNEELGRLQKLVYEAIVAVAKDEKFDLILGDSVLFANQRVDVTELVLKRLQKEFIPASAPAKTN